MKRFLAITAICLTFAPAWVSAQTHEPTAPMQEVSLDRFAELPVQEGGRIMPMDSYARHILLMLSGKSRVNREVEAAEKPEKIPALQWMTETLFTPSRTSGDPVFLINNPEVAQAIGVEADEDRRYSFDFLRPALPKLLALADGANKTDGEARTIVDKEILRLHGNLTTYIWLTMAFEYSRPHPDFKIQSDSVRESLGFEASRVMFSFYDIYRVAGQLTEVISELPQQEAETWTEEQKEMFRLSSAMFSWSRRLQSIPIGMIPLASHGEENWLAPFDALMMRVSDKELYSAIDELSSAASAYLIKDDDQFNKHIAAYQRFIQNRKGDDREIRNLASEVAFNKGRFFFNAKFLYLIAFFVSLMGVLYGNKTVRRLAVLLIVVAFSLHTLGLGWRVFLTARPPVTNLYGTFVFVSIVCVLLGLVAEYFYKNALGSMAASFAGISLLMLAASFAKEGDTMNKVVAVLNSNFWLSTHVIAVSSGYAGVWLAGLIGHIYLLQAYFRPKKRRLLAGTYQPMLGILAFGLTFSFLGTMLGGVWADQSWGRFWGWDPKENGALLIVIWVAILYHARMAGMINAVGMAAGCCLGNIVVMMAWLGVNVLGVGLHSYGFTSGIALGLLYYFIAEMVFVVVMLLLINRKQRKSA